MGFLEPLLTDVWTKDKAPDWAAAAGTWLIGGATIWLTIRVHKASAAQERDRLARVAKEEENRTRREGEAALDEWNNYRSRLARLSIAYEMLATHKPRIRHINARDGIAVVSAWVAAIPKGDFDHIKFQNGSDELVGEIAALDILIEHCLSLARRFLQITVIPIEPLDALPLNDVSQGLLEELFEAARGIAEITDQLGKATDTLRPYIAPDVGRDHAA